MHSKRLRDRAAIGQIWDLREQQEITRETLIQKAAEARYVLIGETHDNEDHHRIQKTVLEAFIAMGKQPALAMEQFDIEHQSAIEQALAAAHATGDSVANAGQFNREGWNWPLYEPLVALAVQTKRPIVAINLSRPAARKIRSLGLNAVLGETRAAQLALDATWSPEKEEALRREIIAGHCGRLPDGLFPTMALAQRTRDALMADALMNSGHASVIAIMGREHARKDIGAPIYLAKRAPESRVVNIGLIEIEENQGAMSDYLAQTAIQRFDFVWFTRPAQRPDPCKDFSLPTAPAAK